ELVKLTQMLMGCLQLLVELFSFLKPSLSLLEEKFVLMCGKQVANSEEYTDESSQQQQEERYCFIICHFALDRQCQQDGERKKDQGPLKEIALHTCLRYAAITLSHWQYSWAYSRVKHPVHR